MPFKKMVIAVFIFVACLCVPAFSEGTEDEADTPPASITVPWQESGIAFGLEYGNYWGRSVDKGKIHTTSVAYHMHQYFTKIYGKFGFFSHTSLLGFPYVDAINGERPGYIDYWGRQIRMAAGLFLDHAFNEKWSLFCGAGAQASYTRERYAHYVSQINREEKTSTGEPSMAALSSISRCDMQAAISFYWQEVFLAMNYLVGLL